MNYKCDVKLHQDKLTWFRSHSSWENYMKSTCARLGACYPIMGAKLRETKVKWILVTHDLITYATQLTSSEPATLRYILDDDNRFGNLNRKKSETGLNSSHQFQEPINIYRLLPIFTILTMRLQKLIPQNSPKNFRNFLYTPTRSYTCPLFLKMFSPQSSRASWRQHTVWVTTRRFWLFFYLFFLN